MELKWVMASSAVKSKPLTGRYPINVWSVDRANLKYL